VLVEGLEFPMVALEHLAHYSKPQGQMFVLLDMDVHPNNIGIEQDLLFDRMALVESSQGSNQFDLVEANSLD
jgi:hypothetical protein